MLADLVDALHRMRPVGTHIDRMVMRGRANFGQEDSSRCDSHGDFLRHVPLLGLGYMEFASLAGKRKLAAIDPVVVLIDDFANGLWIGGIAHAVKYDL